MVNLSLLTLVVADANATNEHIEVPILYSLLNGEKGSINIDESYSNSRNDINSSYDYIANDLAEKNTKVYPIHINVNEVKIKESLANKLKKDPILCLHADKISLSGLTEDEIKEASEQELFEFTRDYLQFGILAAKKCAAALKGLN